MQLDLPTYPKIWRHIWMLPNQKSVQSSSKGVRFIHFLFFSCFIKVCNLARPFIKFFGIFTLVYQICIQKKGHLLCLFITYLSNYFWLDLKALGKLDKKIKKISRVKSLYLVRFTCFFSDITKITYLVRPSTTLAGA